MRSSPGRPRKRAPRKPSQQPTDVDVRRFVQDIDKMALSHQCGKPGLHEVPKRKDIDG